MASAVLALVLGVPCVAGAEAGEATPQASSSRCSLESGSCASCASGGPADITAGEDQDELLCFDCREVHLYLGARSVNLLPLHGPVDSPFGGGGIGPGVSATAGLRLGPGVGLEFNWTTTWHDASRAAMSSGLNDDLVLMSYTGDLRLYPIVEGPVDLFIFGGGGYAYIGTDLQISNRSMRVVRSGPTLEVGGGIDIWLSEYWSLGGEMYYRTMFLDGSPSDPSSGRQRYGFIGVDLSLMLHL